MSRTPPPNDGMTRKEFDIGDSDLSLDPAGLLNDPAEEDEEIDELPESPVEMLDRCLRPDTRSDELGPPDASTPGGRDGDYST